MRQEMEAQEAEYLRSLGDMPMSEIVNELKKHAIDRFVKVIVEELEHRFHE